MKRILTTIAVVALSCLTAVSVYAQGAYTVKAVVSDKVGPVTAASVIEAGTSNGTMTNADGSFAIKVASKDAVVEISCIGYVTEKFVASQVPA